MTTWQEAMSTGNLPKIVDKIDPYNQSSLKRVRRGSVGSTRFHAKTHGDLKPLPLLKGKLYSCLFNLSLVTFGEARTKTQIDSFTSTITDTVTTTVLHLANMASPSCVSDCS